MKSKIKNSKRSIHKFILLKDGENSVVGDLASDILIDEDFPLNKSRKKMFRYLKTATIGTPANDVIKDFKAAYNAYKHNLKYGTK